VTFEDALRAMKLGATVARRSWEQPDTWVHIFHPPAPLAGDGTDEAPYAMEERRPYLERRLDGGMEPWLPTHDGLFADDWYMVQQGDSLVPME